jgi:hypothetical protein
MPAHVLVDEENPVICDECGMKSTRFFVGMKDTSAKTWKSWAVCERCTTVIAKRVARAHEKRVIRSLRRAPLLQVAQ